MQTKSKTTDHNVSLINEMLIYAQQRERARERESNCSITKYCNIEDKCNIITEGTSLALASKKQRQMETTPKPPLISMLPVNLTKRR